MNRLLLIFLICSATQIFGQQTEKVLVDVPSSYNDAILQRTAAITLANKARTKSLLGKRSSAAKNESDAIQEVVHVQSGKMVEVCIDTSDIAGNFGVLNDLACSSLTFGAISIDENCFSFTAATGIIVGRDTLCVELCDLSSNCTSLIFPIEVRNPLAPPFFEDFSNSSIVPDPSKWQNTDVFVNGTIGINPPSLGVATFDGIDKNGRPYGTGHGPSDQLTSTFIDLNAFNATDDVYFSFWVQPQGYGDRPEQIDSLIIEFKDENGVWSTVQKFEGVPLDTPSTKQIAFSSESIQLIDEKYFHDGFQFRITNHSTNSGAVDNWHLDYITIKTNSAGSANLDDLAFTRLPDPIIYEYTSMPWKHYIEAQELLRDSFTVQLFNHSDVSRDATPSFLTVQEEVTNMFLPTTAQIILDGTQRNVPANAAVSFTNEIMSFAGYQNNVANVSGDNAINIRLAIDPGFENGGTLNNNIVNRRTVFSDYFAYDDGSAETNIIAQGNGTEIGVEYQTYADDSLRAVAISFINVKGGVDISNELFNLKIYVGSLQSDPVLENVLLKPILTNSLFDTIQSFTTYALIDPVTEQKVAIPIQADEKFYIGFQTASTNPIPIGFDRNSLEAADNNFLALSSGWFPFPQTHQGAVMIRPIFGSGPAITTSTSDPVEELSEMMQVFPNPTDGLLNFVSRDANQDILDYTAYNTLGQIVQRGRLTSQVDFSRLMDGVYYLKLIKRGTPKVYNHKFILSR